MWSRRCRHTGPIAPDWESTQSCIDAFASIQDPTAGLPRGADGMARDKRVRSEQREAVGEGLTNEHAVEGVTVMVGKLAEQPLAR